MEIKIVLNFIYTMDYNGLVIFFDISSAITWYMS